MSIIIHVAHIGKTLKFAGPRLVGSLIMQIRDTYLLEGGCLRTGAGITHIEAYSIDSGTLYFVAFKRSDDGDSGTHCLN